MGVHAESDHIIQGEYRISKRPDSVLTTLLGSCVAACIWDPVLQIGGMNHFLLPGTNDLRDDEAQSLRYGAYAMELLVNSLLAQGAKRQQLRAKLFGGARMLASLTDLGARNADFAERYLRQENIRLMGGSLRGDRGRRIEFWPVSGRTRQLLIGGEDVTERFQPMPSDHGSVELF